MGSGKTTLGKELAQHFKRVFIDTDTEISKLTGKTIQQIFTVQGEAAFRELELQLLKQIITSNSKAVVALGGGTVCNEENLELLKKNGLLVYIQLPATELAHRLENQSSERPLLAGLRGEALLAAIEQKLTERNPFYESAAIMVNGINLSAELLYRIICASCERQDT